MLVSYHDHGRTATGAHGRVVGALPLSRCPFRGMLGGVSDLAMLRDRMRQFADARDWGRFHDPKSVLLALVGEVGELVELFQWLPAAEASELARHEPLRTRVGEEMADVLLYLVLLADVVDIDLAAAAQAKMDDSERRFPPSAAGERAR